VHLNKDALKRKSGPWSLTPAIVEQAPINRGSNASILGMAARAATDPDATPHQRPAALLSQEYLDHFGHHFRPHLLTPAP
jgi:hypothetical protein